MYALDCATVEPLVSVYAATTTYLLSPDGSHMYWYHHTLDNDLIFLTRCYICGAVQATFPILLSLDLGGALEAHPKIGSPAIPGCMRFFYQMRRHGHVGQTSVHPKLSLVALG
jgi:hypothetical protein